MAAHDRDRGRPPGRVEDRRWATPCADPLHVLLRENVDGVLASCWTQMRRCRTCGASSTPPRPPCTATSRCRPGARVDTPTAPDVAVRRRRSSSVSGLIAATSLVARGDRWGRAADPHLVALLQRRRRGRRPTVYDDSRREQPLVPLVFACSLGRSAGGHRCSAPTTRPRTVPVSATTSTSVDLADRARRRCRRRSSPGRQRLPGHTTSAAASASSVLEVHRRPSRDVTGTARRRTRSSDRAGSGDPADGRCIGPQR